MQVLLQAVILQLIQLSAAWNILSGDRANLTFAYKLTYANSTDANPTVTISGTSVTGTESGNYEFTWRTGLTGTVVADEFTDAAITLHLT